MSGKKSVVSWERQNQVDAICHERVLVEFREHIEHYSSY